MICGLSLLAALGLTHIAHAEVPKESDVKAMMAVYPRHGADHHALVERGDGETLDALTQRAFTGCDDERCRIVAVFQKGDCVSVAKGKSYIYWNWDQNDIAQTRERATDACTRSSESCQLEKSVCFPK